jgi:hypothetical protein
LPDPGILKCPDEASLIRMREKENPAGKPLKFPMKAAFGCAILTAEDSVGAR